MRDRSWSRVRRRISMAARFARRRELRDFHARIVRIVNVQPTFPIAANSRPGNLLRSILAKLFCGGLNVPHAEGKMILCAKRLVVSGGRNVQHVLNPVIAIRNLQLVPVDAVILHTALPVKLEAKQIDVKAILRDAVLHDKAGMNEVSADLVQEHGIINNARSALYEGKSISFGIAQLEVPCAVAVFGNRTRGNAMCDEILEHSRYVVCSKA